MNASIALNDQQEAAQYHSVSGLQLIVEKKITDFVTQNLGISTQWAHEATEISTGNMLFCEVKYGGFTKARWTAAIVQKENDGSYSLYRLLKMPTIRKNSKAWNLTMTGWLYRSEGRA